MNDGKLYANFNQSQRFDAKTVLDEFSHLFKWRCDGSDKLLDIGCGPGDVLKDFILPKVPENCQIVGIDISEEMVKFASKNVDHIKFYSLDIADELDVCQRVLSDSIPFDNITSFYCQHWIQDQKKSLINIYNMLKPGGAVLMIFPTKCPIFDIYETLAGFDQYQQYMKDVEKFISPYHKMSSSMDFFNNIVSSVGFQSKHCEIRDQLFLYDNIQQLRNVVKSVNPFTERMPQCLQNQFIDDYVKLAEPITQCKSNDLSSKVISPYQLLVAVLTK